MSDLNSYSFTGRLGNPPEMKYTNNGTAVWNASVGVGYGYGDNKGTNWLRVQVFGKRAESLGKLELDKGAAVGVTGELRVRTYDTRDGGKGTSVEVVAQDVALLGKREGSAGSGGSRGGAPQRDRPARATDAPPAGDFQDDDIPFVTARGNF
jgi:single-strand DNA-binding protein